ncbi:sulfur carrier protein ThiS [Hathewaya limosa]|uniref:Sulfur carrier protein n=1 Tax=Hathewaya limosa TaxID=1536 RepID=A0ABU0JP63_HATLI|nr:sulfur carrier protein ThiS [Hathewaya limosa]MDQ0478877.1 sulfur carrier protein [Hathewaya limosa]
MKEGEKMKINGKEFSSEGIKNISSLLNKLNVNESKVVVELNKEIIAKEDYSKINLEDDDTIEIVSFVGGG